MTHEERIATCDHNIKVAEAFSTSYALLPLAKGKDGEPLVLIMSDDNGNHNAAVINKYMSEKFADALWTVQTLLDATITLAPQLRWRVQDGYVPPTPPAPPPSPVQERKKDNRSSGAKLKDIGVWPVTWKATPKDLQEQERKREADRQAAINSEKLKERRMEFLKALSDANNYVEVAHNRPNWSASFAERDKMRKAVRTKYPEWANECKQPEAEKSSTRF